jgi:hypothetical protein
MCEGLPPLNTCTFVCLVCSIRRDFFVFVVTDMR